MATVTKDFRVKNGLVVEGSNATVNGSQVLTEASSEFLQDTTAQQFADGTHSGIDFSYNETTGAISATVSSTPTFSTEIIFEGATADSYQTTLQVTDPVQDITLTLPSSSGTIALTTDLPTMNTDNVTEEPGATNKYFTDERAQDAVGNAVGTGIHYNDTTGAISVDRPTVDAWYDEAGAAATAEQNANEYTDNALYPNGILGNPAFDIYGSASTAEANANSYTDTAINALDTDDIEQGIMNKYYSDALVDNHLSGGDGITYSAGAISVDLDVAGGLGINQGTLGINRTTVDSWYDAAGAATTAYNNAVTYADALDTDDIAEGVSNIYFTNQRALDATAAAYDLAGAASAVQGNLDTHTNATAAHGVTGDIVGTTDPQTLFSKTIGDVLTFNDGSNNSTIDVDGNDLYINANSDLTLSTANGDIVLNPDGHAYIGGATAGNEVATHSYVDNAISGLDWKQSVNLLASSTVSTTGTAGTLVIDGHSALDSGDVGYRILLTNQSVDSENGIYTYTESAGSYTLVRSDDADAFGELVGAAVYVMEGTTYGGSSWVQSNHYLTDFTNQDWTQFSGAGTVTAGTGITVNGLEVSVDRTTVDTWYEPDGAVSTHSGLTTGVHGVTGDVVGTTNTQTLSNKTLASPTITAGGSGYTVGATLVSGLNFSLSGASDQHNIGGGKLSIEPNSNLDLTAYISVNDVIYLYSAGNTALNAMAWTVYSVDSSFFVLDSTSALSPGDFADLVVTEIKAANSSSVTISSVELGYLDGVTSNIQTQLNAKQATLSAGTGISILSNTVSFDSTSTPTLAGLSLTNALSATAVTFANSQAGSATATAGTTATTIDSWSTSTYSSAKYLVQLKNGSDIEVIEVLVTVDGNNNVYITEYADVISNVELGTTDAVYSGGNVELLVTAVNSGTSVKVHKTLIEA